MRCIDTFAALLDSRRFVSMKRLFLFLGLGLSALSKVLQAGFQSIWGDILILPAATMFVLAILLYWPRYVDYLKNSRTKNKAKAFALFSCFKFSAFYHPIFWSKNVHRIHIYISALSLYFPECLFLVYFIKRKIIGLPKHREIYKQSF